MEDMKLPDLIDVVIVGMGPVGAALANLLGLQETRTLVIDKATEIFAAPRAIALDNEALRVLQMCGLEEGELDTVAIPEVKMLSPIFGQYSRAVTAGAIDGHPRLVTFYQPQLETILRRRASALSSVSVRLGVEFVDFEQSPHGVAVTLRTPDGSEHRVHAKYVVGADGAGSLVRRSLGLGFDGKTYTEDWLVVDAKKVSQPIEHVEFICDHRRPTPHMVAPGGRQRWEFKLHAGETREQMEHPHTVRELLRPWTGDSQPEIERVAVYRFHARIVDRFQRGRVFLVGDAAHITPPFVGQGLVAGLRDVANLAWKLSWAARGQVNGAVLESYDAERRPHVKSMINLARFMGKLVMPGNAAIAWLTHGLMNLASRVPLLRRQFEDLEIKPPHRFKRGCFAPRGSDSRLTRGGIFPQVWLRTQTQAVRLSDDVLGRGFAVVGFGVDPTLGVSASVLQAWRALDARFVQIGPRGSAPAGSDADAISEDFTGSLLPFVVPVGWIAVVRPDRIVLHDGSAARASALLKEALALLVPPETSNHRITKAVRPSALVD
jgi:3-(3-hydroxy-phenyl)propionate hydroxylase